MCDFDLFVRTASGTTLYRSRSTPITEHDFERLTSRGVKTLFVRYADHVNYCDYLHRNILNNDDLSLGDRYTVLRTATQQVFEDAMRTDDATEIVRVSSTFAAQMTETLCSQELLMRDLFALMIHDYYTFTHAMNVATYTLAIAGRMGLKKEDITLLAGGALVHDIGKRNVPPAVLNKTTTLSEEERAIIQQHPQWGFEQLCSQASMCWGQLMMVYQHHERLDGRGYPGNMTGAEIHDWAKICAVADVFDALTCDRPYRKAFTISEAREFFDAAPAPALTRRSWHVCWKPYRRADRLAAVRYRVAAQLGRLFRAPRRHRYQLAGISPPSPLLSCARRGDGDFAVVSQFAAQPGDVSHLLERHLSRQRGFLAQHAHVSAGTLGSGPVRRSQTPGASHSLPARGSQLL